jgi:uncharacterized LabA/DUF88 family protein
MVNYASRFSSSLPNYRVMIFIDGGYLKKKISELSPDYEIDHSRLAHLLSQHWKGGIAAIEPRLIRVYYYDGSLVWEQIHTYPDEGRYVDDLFNEKIDEQKYLEKIDELEYFEVRRGHLILSTKGGVENRKNWEWRQKGVDSLIAIDMITKAYQGQYDLGILVAGDLDFLEIVKATKNVGIRVMGAYFPKNINSELVKAFDKKYVFEETKLVNDGIISKIPK